MRRIFCILAIALVASAPLQAAEPGCGQALVDGTTPPATAAFITPRAPVTPFYQWENNDGYCGEVTLMQAGLSNGQWINQLNTRLLCGTGLSQSGPNGACAAHDNIPNYNAQLLIETPGTGVTGPNPYADAAQCMANARLAGTTYPYETAPTGLAGYQAYMSWVKAQVIAGSQVTLAVLINGATDPQYDHEVAVLKIGTNHAVNDPTYYDDDVIYFDDHGAYTLNGTKFGTNPAIPPGAGADIKGCTPYIFGYSFGSLPNTRSGANKKTAQAYSVIIPDNITIRAAAGGTGYATLPIKGPHNYGFAVSGPLDAQGETLPVTLTIAGPSFTRGKQNPADPIAGYNYENPMIGANVLGNGCTNIAPKPMTHFTLQATITGLQPGTGYNLYEYDAAAPTGTGTQAALAVPTRDFNANAALATHTTSFTAIATRFTTTVTTTSDRIIVFRAVPAAAP